MEDSESFEELTFFFKNRDFIQKFKQINKRRKMVKGPIKFRIYPPKRQKAM